MSAPPPSLTDLGDQLGAWWDAELEKQRARKRAVVEGKVGAGSAPAPAYDPLTVLWPDENFSR